MMNSVFLQFLFGAGCIGVGFFTGLGLSWREYRIGKRQFAAPKLSRTERQQAYVLVAVALMAVVSTAYAALNTIRQNTCNQEFKVSLVTRGGIATENTRHLNEMLFTVADAISHPQPDSRARMQRAILDYRDWAETAERRRAEHPIADPKCEG